MSIVLLGLPKITNTHRDPVALMLVKMISGLYMGIAD
jgi:hypothetical protein